jgi:hypothetical protein
MNFLINCLLALTPALYIAASANAAPRAILPPPEYDHPYDTQGGRRLFDEVRVDTVEALKERCKHPFNPPSIPLACAFPMSWGYLIVMVTDDMIRAGGYEPEHIRRHEVGHCNGWPSHHPDTRWTP